MSPLDRRYELEIERRSLAMMSRGAPAWPKEKALAFVDELEEVRGELERLREGMRALLEPPDVESSR
jgi:hypothetical protein